MKIYVLCDKRPDFIKIQYESLKHFSKEPFELFILNNGSSILLRLRIMLECNKLNVRCIQVPFKKYANANMACAEPLQWAYDNYMKKSKSFAILDSDMFLISDLSFDEYLNSSDVCGVLQYRGEVTYLWNGLLFFNSNLSMNDLNFMPGIIENEKVDVGGHLYHWIRMYAPKVKEIHHSSHIKESNHNLDELPLIIRKKYLDKYTFEIYDKKFLHYGRGSNWANESKLYHKHKSSLLRDFVYGAIEGSIKLP